MFPNTKVKLNVFTKDLSIDNMELTIEKMSKLSVKLTWRPESADASYKSTIYFEVTNNERLKFHVHCYGECTPTTTIFKKPVRKPLSILQPIANDSSTTTQRKGQIVSRNCLFLGLSTRDTWKQSVIVKKILLLLLLL